MKHFKLTVENLSNQKHVKRFYVSQRVKITGALKDQDMISPFSTCEI